MKYKLAKLNDQNNDLDKRWYVYYSFKHPETKKNILKKHYIPLKLKTLKARREYAYDLIQRLNKTLISGVNPYENEDSRLTCITAALEKVIELKRMVCRQRTYYSYRNYVKIFIEFLKKENYDKLPSFSISHKHAQAFMDWILLEKKVKIRTYNNYKTGLTTIFNELVERNYSEINPFLRIKKFKKQDPEISFYTVEERNVMREKLPGLNFELFVISQLIYYCFLRPQEIVRLRIENIDLANRCINIPPDVSKNKKQQKVNIPDSFLPVISKLNIIDFPRNYYVFSKNLKPGTFLIAPTRIAGAWQKARIILGINRTLYNLKHTGIGVAIAAGINLRDIQLQGRHYSLEYTQIYADKISRTPSEKLNQLFPQF